MVGWSPETSARAIAIDSVGQGVGLGFVFVPLNTIAFATLPGEFRTDGAAIWTLIRNLGSSIGISLIIAKLTSDMIELPQPARRVHHPVQRRAADARRRGRLSTAGQGLAAIEAMVTQQAAMMAYSNDFLMMTFVSLGAFPLLALIRSARQVAAAAPQEAPHAVMD